MSDDIVSFSDLLRSALGNWLAKGSNSFVDMVTDDVVMEFPFSPPGIVTRLEGKQAIADHLQRLGGLLEISSMSAPTVHRSVDPDHFVLEFEGHGRGLATGEPYDQQYISVIRLRDGKIAHYRDYWNPLVVLRALGDLPAVAAHSEVEAVNG
jgi:ketosteroid isomerase-like protein